jgi:hypothetical protein
VQLESQHGIPDVAPHHLLRVLFSLAL